MGTHRMISPYSTSSFDYLCCYPFLFLFVVLVFYSYIEVTRTNGFFIHEMAGFTIAFVNQVQSRRKDSPFIRCSMVLRDFYQIKPLRYIIKIYRHLIALDLSVCESAILSICHANDIRNFTLLKKERLVTFRQVDGYNGRIIACFQLQDLAVLFTFRIRNREIN